jgi:hypothetical protein
MWELKFKKMESKIHNEQKNERKLKFRITFVAGQRSDNLTVNRPKNRPKQENTIFFYLVSGGGLTALICTKIIFN